nr:RNA-directed DNA polymerase, eukaryota [Tanacetum cinerariifolium]
MYEKQVSYNALFILSKYLEFMKICIHNACKNQSSHGTSFLVRNNKKGAVVKLKEDLRFLDEEIDKGKIKWYVDGDENVKFFHGMLNKKRSQLNIRGVMKNGTWTDNPNTMKQEFFHHFKNRFEKPSNQRVSIDMSFPNVLSIDQQEDLERMVSKEEVKKAVWDCGMDKSPGPDGFTFGFYRHFWSTIECDIVNEVQSAFIKERQILDVPFILNE